ncbi:hypothetical protein ACFFMP_14740, partial [Pseudoroseomonas cervicalis]
MTPNGQPRGRNAGGAAGGRSRQLLGRRAALGLTPSAVSRLVSRSWRTGWAPLLLRSTRALRTDSGGRGLPRPR